MSEEGKGSEKQLGEEKDQGKEKQAEKQAEGWQPAGGGRVKVGLEAGLEEVPARTACKK